MKIGINLIFLYELSGIGIYVKNLLENFGKIDQKDKFLIFVTKSAPKDVYFNFRNFKYVKIPINSKNYFLRILIEQLISPFLSLIYNLDILFTPAVFSPFFCFCKKVTTIHDIGYLEDRRFNLKNLYLKFVTKASLKSEKIITVSYFSKKEILSKFKIAEEKIRVIYEGVNQKIIEIDKVKEIKAKFNLPNNYFFYIGLITPHKNIENILKAFKSFSEKHNNIEFILAGPERRNLLNLENLLNNLSLKTRVRYLGIISEEEKFTLFKNSLALIFPSLHEGFGLSVLEAQSLGIPVLTSNITSLPEIAGEGALFVNPYNIEDIEKGMEEIAFNENLRKELIQKGYENIKRFSWEKAAKQLSKLFHSL